MPTNKAALDNLAAAVQTHDANPWFMALFHAALDDTRDVDKALAIASSVYGQHPAEPVGPTGPKAPQTGLFGEGDAITILTAPVRRLDKPKEKPVARRFSEQRQRELDIEEARLRRRLREVEDSQHDERLARLLAEMPAPQVTVQMPAPVINIPPSVINVPPTVVNVAPAEAPVVNVTAPPVTVNVPPSPKRETVTKLVERDEEGNITRIVEDVK